MKRRGHPLCLVALTLIMCLALSCAGEAGKTAEQIAADKEAIATFIDHYEKTLKAGDIDGWSALWDDDAKRMEPFTAPVVGKEAIKNSMQSLLDMSTIDLKINNEEIAVIENWGYISGTFTYTAILKMTPDTVNVSGSYLSIMKMQEDGNWKVFRECYNSDNPPRKPEETGE